MTGPASLLVTRLEAFAPDIVFNLAEGHRGKTRRAFYPALFEELGMPSTGSDAYTLCVTLDKALTKKQLAGWGVPSPRGRFVTRASLRSGGLDELPFPVLVKPNFEGSSKGIGQDSVVEDPIALGRVLDEVLAKYPDGALVERYVPGDRRAGRVRRGAARPAAGRDDRRPRLRPPLRRLRLQARQRRHALRRAPRPGPHRPRPRTTGCAT